MMLEGPEPNGRKSRLPRKSRQAKSTPSSNALKPALKNQNSQKPKNAITSKSGQQKSVNTK